MGDSDSPRNRAWLWFLLALGVELYLLYLLAINWTVPAAPVIPVWEPTVVTKIDQTPVTEPGTQCLTLGTRGIKQCE